jgi:hypothetical protein
VMPEDAVSPADWLLQAVRVKVIIASAIGVMA